MLPTEFNSLPVDTRIDLIWTKGKFSEIVYESAVYKIVIYLYNGFFVEIIYNSLDHKMIEVLACEDKIDKEEVLKKLPLLNLIV